MTPQNIAFLGLGAMGSRMAHNLLAAGHDLFVYNRTAERAEPLVEQGAVFCQTPAQAAAQADIVIAMVRDDQASRQVWLHPQTGALHGMRPNTIAVESSTLTPAWIRELAHTLQTHDLRLLEAPVAGTTPQAEERLLFYMLGGEQDLAREIEPVLLCMGKTCKHIGGHGKAAYFKLTVNSLLAIQTAAFAEHLGALQAAGVDTDLAQSTLAAMPITAPALTGLSAAMLTSSFTPMFPVELVEKDLAYALAAAAENDAELPSTAAARETFARAKAQGHGSLNLHAVIKVF